MEDGAEPRRRRSSTTPTPPAPRTLYTRTSWDWKNSTSDDDFESVRWDTADWDAVDFTVIVKSNVTQEVGYEVLFYTDCDEPQEDDGGTATHIETESEFKMRPSGWIAWVVRTW